MGQELSEKEFALSMGRRLAQLLRKQGVTVYMTRDDDRSLTLDERTRYANKCQGAALLVSLHGNATPNSTVHGIETFYMEPNLFKIEHTSFEKEDHTVISDYKDNLGELSKNLASKVHQNLLKTAQKFQNVVDRKVKKQAGQVLFAEMPSILIECGFLSNPEEYQLLIKDTYQEALALSIAQSIMDFFETSFA